MRRMSESMVAWVLAITLGMAAAAAAEPDLEERVDALVAEANTALGPIRHEDDPKRLNTTVQ